MCLDTFSLHLYLDCVPSLWWQDVPGRAGHPPLARQSQEASLVLLDQVPLSRTSSRARLGHESPGHGGWCHPHPTHLDLGGSAALTLPAMCPWTSYLMSLCLSVPTCEVGTVNTIHFIELL